MCFNASFIFSMGYTGDSGVPQFLAAAKFKATHVNHIRHCIINSSQILSVGFLNLYEFSFMSFLCLMQFSIEGKCLRHWIYIF